MQTERESAIAADSALRGLEVDAQSDDWWSKLGVLHNRWQDDVAMPAMRLRDTETRRRVQMVGYTLFLAMQAAKGEHTIFAFLAAVEDARAALNALLQNNSLPSRSFPTRDQLTDLCPLGPGGLRFEPLNEWLDANFPGFRQLA